MPEYLIIDAAADAYADEIARLTGAPCSGIVCTSGKQAVEKYSGQPVVFGNPDMVASVLAELPNVEWVQSTWAGVTPLTAVPRRDYVLTGIKDVFGPPMSEYVTAYMLAHELKLFERMQHQRAHDWFPKQSGTLFGKHLCVLGTGSIGAYIARVAKAFGMQTTGINRSGTATDAFDQIKPVNEMHDILVDVDYLVATLPATAETNNLVDAKALARLPANACFINVGRSNVVNDDALMQSLRENKLAGAVLDVFDTEPLPKDSPLWETPNLVITAHKAAPSQPSLIAPVFVENYRRYCEKQPLKYVVGFERGY
ncbi:hypothetical protein BA177_09350 [Woeseia oceani]|uniref:D-isomer specific 2-hydroxyacid dehydrogenase NAD-binding domain-containing protein n=2 Tax=Woeseia oceani TaxID=1548547 RepID=A0A193LFU7_9GAMM|nr:hypothetical protein BA177_09350 [Woeseia oceani]